MKMIMKLFKPGKQYMWTLPYVHYWGCDEYHFVQFFRHSWKSWLGESHRINGNVFFTILYDRGKLTFERDKEDMENRARIKQHKHRQNVHRYRRT